MVTVDSNATRPTDFWDEDTSQMVTVTNLTIRDQIYFRLLQRIEKAIKGIQ